jgi:ribosomal protein L29
MKKHMEKLLKLDNATLRKRSVELKAEIIESRRGVIGGEIQNTQVVKQKRRELARVNTLLNTSSNSVTNVNATKSKVSSKAAVKPSTSRKIKETK